MMTQASVRPCSELDGDYTQMASSYNLYHSRNTRDTIGYIEYKVIHGFKEKIYNTWLYYNVYHSQDTLNTIRNISICWCNALLANICVGQHSTHRWQPKLNASLIVIKWSSLLLLLLFTRTQRTALNLWRSLTSKYEKENNNLSASEISLWHTRLKTDEWKWPCTACTGCTGYTGCSGNQEIVEKDNQGIAVGIVFTCYCSEYIRKWEKKILGISCL